MRMRVVIAAGGTAGHVFPGIAVAESLRDRFGAEVRFIGRRAGQETSLVPKAGFPLASIDARPFTRGVSSAIVWAPLAAIRSALRCRPLVRDAHVVVGMGGFVSVPVSLASWWERVPLVVHEQNAIAGLANRMAARWARTVALAFEEARAKLPRRTSAVVTGNPVRPSVLRVREERKGLATEALEVFDLSKERRTIVVFGGSQGALHLDRDALGACRLLASREDLQMLLITGPAHEEAVRRAFPPASGLRVRTASFVDRMELVYALADLVVARAGASTVAELSACGVPAVLVPYPYATGNHQEANARALQRAGGATVLLDEELNPPSLVRRIEALVDQPERMEAMAAASLEFGKPDAADRLADVVGALGAAS